ncbi:MAG: PorP/SprF family type IX secretion system membrane protein [Bacteroidales bacterium]|nr:PorP/SprF family type IX secretion system membrane protein [Bacteroidales bacterium]
MVTYFYKIVILLVFSSIFFLQTYAQNVDFSQTNSNFVYLNPAFAGMEDCPRLYTSYRIKELTFDGGYMTYYVSADTYMSSLDGDVSISFIHDIQQDVLFTSSAMFAYAKEFQVHRFLHLKTSLGAGFSKQKLLEKKQVFSNMLHPLYGEVENQSEIVGFEKNYFDSEVGILLYNDWFYSGISIKHINHFFSYKRNSHIPFVPQVSLHGGGHFSNSKGFQQSNSIWFYPHTNVTISRISSYAIFSMIAKIDKLQLGVGYRQNLPISNESFVFFVGFVEKKYKFAYNCDVVIKPKLGDNFNSHEFSLTYQFECIGKRKKHGAIKAPGF